MFSRVLCPIDFSDHSLRALRYATALAARAGGRVIALHAADPLLVEAAAATFGPGFVERDAERGLAEIVARNAVAAGTWAPPVVSLVRVGDPAGVILAYAAETAADAVVMGTHGLSGYRKMFLGSVTGRVLRRAPLPVLVVGGSEDEQVAYGVSGPEFRIERVLAPVDFGRRSLGDARIAVTLAAGFSVPLLVVHVVHQVRASLSLREALSARERIALARAREKIDRLAAQLEGRTAIETLVTTGQPADEVAAIAAERKVGLIVMGLGGDGGALGARPGTIAYRVLCLAGVPVLALPPGADGQ